MITFQGNFYNPVFIKKRCNTKLFQDFKASFVELNPVSSNDSNMLKEVSSVWQDGTPGGTYAVEIKEMFDNAHLHSIESGADLFPLPLEEANERFFTITPQQQNFENLDPARILALAKTTKESNNTIWLDFLQVNPDNNYNAEYPIYKRVGSAVIESLKSIFKGKRIELVSDFDAIPFYEKMGFRKVENGKENQLYINA